MKRSFYEILGVRADANPAEIERAFTSMVARFGATTSLRGTAETLRETQLIHEGYRILSDPARRAEYDSKVLGHDAVTPLELVPDEDRARRNLTLQISGFAFGIAILAGVAWSQMTHRIDQVRIEHQQALVRQKGAPQPPAQVAVDAEDAQHADSVSR